MPAADVSILQKPCQYDKKFEEHVTWKTLRFTNKLSAILTDFWPLPIADGPYGIADKPHVNNLLKHSTKHEPDETA